MQPTASTAPPDDSSVCCANAIIVTALPTRSPTNLRVLHQCAHCVTTHPFNRPGTGPIMGCMASQLPCRAIPHPSVVARLVVSPSCKSYTRRANRCTCMCIPAGMADRRRGLKRRRYKVPISLAAGPGMRPTFNHRLLSCGRAILQCRIHSRAVQLRPWFPGLLVRPSL